VSEQWRHIMDDGSSKPLTEELMNKYLSGKATPEEQRLVEESMANDDFENDALEGLETLPNAAERQSQVKELNNFIQQQTASKKTKRKRKFDNLNSWMYIIVTTVFFLIIIGLLVWYYSKPKT
jgi:hypothetical protein